MTHGTLLTSFDVHGKPQPRGSKRSIPLRNRKTGAPIFKANGAIMTATVDDNPKSGEWMNQVSAAAMKARVSDVLCEGPVVLTLTINILRPKGHFGKRGLLPSSRKHPTVKPDSSKILRGIEDALTGIVYRDDCQIVMHEIVKQYADQQGVSVQVYAMGGES